MGKKFRRSKDKGLENFCVSIIRWITYLILFTPLVLARDSFFPFVTPKTIYFRILAEIMLAGFIILAIFIPRYRPKINILTIALVAFIGISVVASFLGINLSRSFWSTYERMTGLFTLFHLLALFIILTSVFKTRKDWEKILSVSIIVGVLLSLYVLTAQEISTRGGGTIGNTSFMATYLLFDIFFALILFFEKRAPEWKVFSAISLLLMVATVLASDARGAKVSMFSGFVLMFLAYLIFSQRKHFRTIGIILILFSMALSVVLALWRPPLIQEGIGTLLKQMKPRFVVWEKAWKGFLEKPILGWGPENFNVVFSKFFNPCMFVSECGREIWFDRAHNVALDTLVTTGILGFLSYFLIFIVSAIWLLKTFLKTKEHLFSFFGVMILLGIYFFQNLLVFDMISSYVVFFLSLSFVSFLIEEKGEITFEEEKKSRFVLPGAMTEGAGRNIILILILIPIVLLLYFGNIQVLKSAQSTVKVAQPETPLGEATESFKKALNGFMEKYEVREQMAQKIYQTNVASQEDRGLVESAFSLAEEQMDESIKANPLDFRPHLFFGRLYFADYQFSGDNEKLNLAESTFQTAQILGPTNQQVYWQLGEIKMVKGEQQQAIDFFQKAVDLEPRLGRSHWYLAMAYKGMGRYNEALNKVKDAEGAGYNWKETLDDFYRVIDIYQFLGDDQSLVSLYEEQLNEHPNNVELWASVAASYANLGQLEKARQAAQKVIEINPDLAPGVEEFLKNL